jgi:hypothetical protein
VIAAPVRYFIAGISFILLGGAISSPVPNGFLEGDLKIVWLKEVQLAGDNVSKSAAQNFADYPLLVLSKDGHSEIAPVQVDEKGHYRVALPPGDYVLDVKRRASQLLRAEPHPFTVVAEQIAHVDMEIDPGVR